MPAIGWITCLLRARSTSFHCLVLGPRSSLLSVIAPYDALFGKLRSVKVQFTRSELDVVLIRVPQRLYIGRGGNSFSIVEVRPMEQHDEGRSGQSDFDGPRSQLLLTAEQAAATLAICRTKVYELLRKGELESVQIGTSRRIPYEALTDYVRRLRSGRSAA
jgi:excisionase family DNA binding protein